MCVICFQCDCPALRMRAAREVTFSSLSFSHASTRIDEFCSSHTVVGFLTTMAAPDKSPIFRRILN